MFRASSIPLALVIAAAVPMACTSSTTNPGEATGGGAGSDASAVGGSSGSATGGSDGGPDAGGCGALSADCDQQSSNGCECKLPANASVDCSSGCHYSCLVGFKNDADTKTCRNFGGSNTPDLCKLCAPTGTPCQCPDGFLTSKPFVLRSPPACADDTTVYFCDTGSVSPTSDWGGAYLKDDADCNQNSTCIVGNPLAGQGPGACACPLGFDTIALRTRTNRCGGVFSSTLAICYNTNTPLSSFGGAFETALDPDGGPPLCLVKNPKTNDCVCAPNTTDHALHVLAPSGAGGEVDAMITLCYAT